MTLPEALRPRYPLRRPPNRNHQLQSYRRTEIHFQQPYESTVVNDEYNKQLCYGIQQVRHLLGWLLHPTQNTKLA